MNYVQFVWLFAGFIWTRLLGLAILRNNALDAIGCIVVIAWCSWAYFYREDKS